MNKLPSLYSLTFLNSLNTIEHPDYVGPFLTLTLVIAHSYPLRLHHHIGAQSCIVQRLMLGQMLVTFKLAKFEGNSGARLGG